MTQHTDERHPVERAVFGVDHQGHGPLVGHLLVERDPVGGEVDPLHPRALGQREGHFEQRIDRPEADHGQLEMSASQR